MAGTHWRALGVVAVVLGLAACPLVFSNPMGARAGRGTALGVVVGGLAVALSILCRLLARRGAPARSGRALGGVGCLLGLVNLVIGMTFLGQTPVFESSAIGEVRHVISSQAGYAASNGGFYDTLGCLEAPKRCLSGQRPEWPAPFDPTLASLATRFGYKRSFHPGPAAPPQEVKRARASASSIVSFAYVAVPERYGSGTRIGLCGDDRGICVTLDGSAPRVEGGRCARPCHPLK